jgi:hypothetical protein
MDFARNTYSLEPKAAEADRIVVEVGDAKQDGFFPQAKVMRWDNEVNWSARLVHTETAPTVTQDGDAVVWAGDKVETRFYQVMDGEGANEIEVTLLERPASNVVQFTLNDKGLTYHYQPALTEEEVKDGCVRPENVVGSYAVYATERKLNVTGGKAYRCGKVGHIYRPRIVDAKGAECWGDLLIKDGLLTVTIPQKFLDDAAYPVRHAAGLTFGYETVGGTMGTWGATLRSHVPATGYTPAQNGTLDSISIYTTVGAAGTYCRLAVYNGTALVGGVAPVDLAGATGWKAGAVAGGPAVSNSASYLMAMQSGSTSGVFVVYDSIPGETMVYNADPYAPTFADPIVWTPFALTSAWSIYATYTATPSGPVNVKGVGGLAAASVKDVGGLAYASIKNVGGLA